MHARVYIEEIYYLTQERARELVRVKMRGIKMLFEASDTCGPTCPALHTVRFSFLFLQLFLVLRFLFLARSCSSARETPP